jgi:hypothetical protein
VWWLVSPALAIPLLIGAGAFGAMKLLRKG